MIANKAYLKYINDLESSLDLYQTTESKITNMTPQYISDYVKWLNVKLARYESEEVG